MARFTIWHGVLLIISVLITLTSGGKLSDVARRKGYSEQTVRDLELRHAVVGGRANTKRRYYGQKTKKYFVESLPDIPADFLTEMYSGVMPLNMSDDSRGLFYVFQPRVGGPPVDEVTIWFNGGPGCSSLEGFFQENGYIQWTWGQYAPTVNPYSWPNLTNVLWVEYPVGVGFSPGKPTATTQEEIALDFVHFFKNFQTTFGIKNYKIYVTGESYAGRYVPYVANAMLDQKDKTYYDLGGILVYDPCIGSYDVQNSQNIYPFITKMNGVLGYNQSYLSDMEAADKKCGFAKYREQYITFPPNGTQPPLFRNVSEDNDPCSLWDSAYNTAYITNLQTPESVSELMGALGTNPCFNVYELGLQCPLLADPLGYPTDLQFNYPGLPTYFNRSDVKKAMHAPNIEWSECVQNPFFNGGDSGPEGEGDTSADPIQFVLPKVIEATKRVLVSNGALDMEILTNGTMLAIQNMTWGGKLGFQSAPSTPIIISLADLEYQTTFDINGFNGLDDHQGIMGMQHYERGLMWAETYLSGHMQPQFQPRSAYRHLQWVLGRIQSL